MKRIARALERADYQVINIEYPSRRYPIEHLTEAFVLPEIQPFINRPNVQLHFVTHSMGGIILRHLLRDHDIQNLGRIVMIAPPNQGTELADLLKNNSLYRMFYGPSGQQLGTDEQSLPKQLPHIDAEVGIICGSRNANLIASYAIPAPHDSRVSVESTKLKDMKDFLVLPYHHSFIMYKSDVIAQVCHFLKNGEFTK